MNHAWDDLPEELWWPLYEAVTSSQWGVTPFHDYMWNHHACYYVTAGSRVNSCDRLAVPGTDYCNVHGYFD